MSNLTKGAFPATAHSTSDGLTKFEYFAGLAMAANLSAHKDTYPDPKNLAKKSVQYAKALMEELDKEEMEYLSQFED